MDSDKNKLQEWCHSHSVDFPIYETLFEGGPPHSPMWRSSVKFMGDTYIGIGKNKKEAEKDVAKKILASLPNESSQLEVTIQQNEELLSEWMNSLSGDVLFVDIDNYNIDIKSIRDSPDKFFLLFGGKINRKKLIPFGSLPNVKIFICDSLIRDAADHLLTLYVGRVYQVKLQRKELANINFYILTKDHFGEATARFVGGIHLMEMFN